MIHVFTNIPFAFNFVLLICLETDIPGYVYQI